MYKTLSAPLVVQIEIESACPNTCMHCYNFWRKNNGSKSYNSHLSLKDIGIIMHKLAEAKVFEVVFTGGEPLLNKSALFYGIELAQKLGIGVSLNSNLIPLTEKDAVFLKRLGVHSILTSIMGPNAAIHDGIVLRNGSFEDTIRGIKYLQKVGFSPTVNIVVSQKNKGYLKKTIKFLASLGINYISSTRAGCPGNCSDFSTLSLSFEDFRRYLEELYITGQEVGISVGVLESYPYCGIKELLRYQQFLGRRCSAGVTTVTIGSNGSVRPCSHLDIQYGNLLSEDIKSIWFKMDECRNGSMIPPECRKCPLLEICGGGCRMEAKMRCGSLNAMDPYSSPKDINFALQQFNKLPKRELKIVSAFSVAEKVRIRLEKFGSVVFVAHRFKAYLNRKSTDFLMGLKPKKTYFVEEVMKWGNYEEEELKRFLSKLADKKIILQRPRKITGGERDGTTNSRF
ncbi:MAG: radical SAM protein [Candidatus Paceibacterota bacterium]|jgi:radical SAM protein with 4Fe4S-binding SPASM domain|nr:radical SAM protein [Candidatus Paceibacterota bacterium]